MHLSILTSLAIFSAFVIAHPHGTEEELAKRASSCEGATCNAQCAAAGAAGGFCGSDYTSGAANELAALVSLITTSAVSNPSCVCVQAVEEAEGKGFFHF